jgi:glycogen phosphorylase
MKDVVLYTVVPQLPDRLQPLMEIAKNLWFCWNLEAIDLFRSLDQNLWEETNHNPLAILGRLGNERIQELLNDEGFLLEMERIHKEFKQYVQDRRAYDFDLETPLVFTIAYFSAEYGLTDCLSIYSGGLGILSGDHLKTASDLRVPLVAMGLFYQKGYFRQYLNADGWQQETYPDNDFHVLPATLVRDANNSPITIEVPIQNRNVKVRVWCIQVGRIPLFLLDTNNIENIPEDRDITSNLYGGDRAMRLKQEIVLGIGGVRALEQMDYRPSVYHMNEGHSALATLERVRLLMKRHSLSFNEAREAVYASNIFTTHTPIPAGIDIFDRPLLNAYLGDYVRSLGISMETLLAMGSEDSNPKDSLNMAVFALKNSTSANAVSELHKKVSRRMWTRLWPELPEADIPIGHVTNGIHIPSWISDDMCRLFDRYLGRRWAEDPDNEKIWERVNRIPDAELWRTHERRRVRLVAFARQRVQEQLTRRGAQKMEIQAASEILNPEILTIGFARRFATYKRGDLILKDPARLAKILNNPQRPVQIIFAGKAHPQDNNGKEVIKNIVHLAQQPELRHRLAFIEDYEMNVTRYMVQGSDVWLNNPRRPLEACGTSGMKAAANGSLNMSILDGWWVEGYQASLGWAIGAGEEYEDLAYQDQIEGEAIYDLLERSIIPLFYERGRDNMPRGWITMMKNSMRTLIARFSGQRMLQDYIVDYYLPAALNWDKIDLSKFDEVRSFSAWGESLRKNWGQLKILEKRADIRRIIQVGGKLEIEVELGIGSISPTNLAVDIYYGPVDSKAQFLDRGTQTLQLCSHKDGKAVFCGDILCNSVGRFGFRVRVLPSHPLLANPYSLGLILWG